MVLPSPVVSSTSRETVMSDASSVLRLLPPLPSLPPFAAWIVDAEGRFLRFTGPAAERARLELGGLFVGRDYREVCPEGSPVRALLSRALEGRTVAERVTWRGLEWFTLAEPLFDDTGLVAVEGVSLLLPATVEPVEAEGEEGAVERWVVERSIRAPGVHWPAGTVLTRAGRLWAETRRVVADVPEIIRQHAPRLRRLDPAPPASAAPRPPTGAAPPGLRLLH